MDKIYLPVLYNENLNNTYSINIGLQKEKQDNNTIDKLKFCLFYYLTRIFPETKLPYTKESEKRMDEILNTYLNSV